MFLVELLKFYYFVTDTCIRPVNLFMNIYSKYGAVLNKLTI